MVGGHGAGCGHVAESALRSAVFHLQLSNLRALTPQQTTLSTLAQSPRFSGGYGTPTVSYDPCSLGRGIRSPNLQPQTPCLTPQPNATPQGRDATRPPSVLAPRRSSGPRISSFNTARCARTRCASSRGLSVASVSGHVTPYVCATSSTARMFGGSCRGRRGWSFGLSRMRSRARCRL